MENSESAQSVRVAVNIRPLITSELMLGCTDCISVVPGEPQVQIGSHAFTYDYVYGSTGSRSSAIYDDCVAPLVDALFNGYNATVLAYGQTGSGKTYTMGTNYTGEENAGGIIPKVMETIFKRVQTMKESSEFLIRVSFIEIFKEEVFDLLDPSSARGDAAATGKAAAPSRVPIQIRETVNGGITLAGVTEAEVKTKEEMSSYLSRGSLSRATGSTNMNSQSSRSHAIFTITMEQKSGDDVLCAKLHLVDLAGSERAKRTGADGMRLKEGIPFACDGAYCADEEDHAKEIEHSSLQEKLGRELKELDKKLEQKEADLKKYSHEQEFEKKILELEQEKKFLQKEIEELRYNLANISSTSDDGAQKLKAEYLQKLNALEAQVSELKKKQEAQAHLLKQKQKSDEAAKRLQDEIHRIKSQKVQLQHKIKQESEQFRLWKASREKEVLQLKKEGRRNEYEMHKLLALNQRQKMVLQRKTEEASLATKRLKELLESRKTSRETTGGNGPGIQALMQAIEHELEVTVRVHEVRSAHERQTEEKTKMAKEIARLKEEADMMKLNNSSDGLVSMSPGARNSRIYALEKMIDSSSTTLLTMASQLSEAEERERVFSGKGRWNQVRSLAEAKNLMNHLFNLASSSRCSLRDREVACREKDMEIRDMKEKVVRLSCSLRQLEMQKSELIHQLKLLRAKRYSESVGDSVYYTTGVGHKYDLRKMENRRSTILLEDMDLSISDTEADDYAKNGTDDEWVASEDDECGASEKIHVRKRKSKSRRASMEDNQSNISSEDVKDNSTEANGGASGETASGICCSCSKSSSCKTNKCKCKALGGTCGSSCGCLASKCANRISVSNESQVEGTGNASSIEESNKDRLLAAQGAELLQGALVEGPAEAHSDHGPRKPLSDIGNTLAKSNAQKANPRKKWGKVKPPVLVVTDPPPSSEDNSEVPKKEDNSINEANIPLKMHSSRPENSLVAPKVEKNIIDTDIPLKIPRAMRKQASSNGGGLPLGDMNAGKPDESVTKKESEVIEARSPVKQKRTFEKENNGR
ncbi:kinesin-like protein KIN-4C [Cajanus cajan]|uniref:kinesin-like protein KIN-4C n=1 Tax=Cajanus cajan TaxID=3821 RepID=UPI0010FB5CD9|nr:kinesin-like protein KIN-4C [Cajanus cajan]